MREIVAGLFITVDGVVEDPDQWDFTFDEQMGEAMGKTLETTDAILMGRSTYEMWSGYWPNYTGGEDAAFADWINDSPKYIVSSTLDNVDAWQNSTLINGDLTTELDRLKKSDGKNISIAGSPRLVASLLEQNLLDELQLMVVPVVAGGGRKKLFPSDSPLKKLTLAGATPTSAGTIIATYRPGPA